MFPLFGGFLTYPLLALVGDVRMLRSSVTTYLRPGFVAGLVCLPLAYVALVWMSARRAEVDASTEPRRFDSAQPRWRRVLTYARRSPARWRWHGSSSAPDAYGSRWTTRADRAIAENPEWVFVSSWWRALRSGGTVEMSDRFDPADLADFEPFGRVGGHSAARARPRQPPLNVILIVLESVGARWTSLNSRVYDNTTPSLVAESAHGLVFDNFYAHIGRSSNSLAAILLSTYPKLDFRDITDEYPRLPGTSLATVFETTRLPHGVHHAERHELGGLVDVSRGPRLRRHPRRSPAVVHRAALVLGRRGPVHVRGDPVLHRPGAGAAVLHHGVDAADAPSLRADAGRSAARPGARAGGRRVRLEPLPERPARNRPASRPDAGRHSPRRAGPAHARGRRRGSRAGVRVSPRGKLHAGADDLRGGRARAAAALVSADVRIGDAVEDDRRPRRSGADHRRAGGAAAGRRTGRAEASSTAGTSLARISMSPRTASSSACARITGSTSTICARRSKSSTISTAIRTSSTISPRPSPRCSARLRQRLAAWTEANRRRYQQR